MKKRSVKILSLVLALLMMLTICPVEAFATGGNQWGWGSGSQGPEMPAQQLKATDSATGVSVTVNAPEGALPQGTTLSVKGVSLPAVQTIVDKSADVNCTVVAAEDITFFYEGTEIEPEKNVSVTLASDAIANTVNPTVLHLDCSAEEIESGSVPVEVMGSGTSFSSKDFSVYVVGNSTNTINLLTVEFWNADGSEIISSQSIRLDQLDQYIANGMDFVHDPGVPEITATQSFEGWADKTSYTEEDTGWSVADINDKIKAEKATLAASTTDLTWKYYAKVYDVVFVTFHDQDGVVIRLESIHLDNGHGDYEVNLSYTPFKGGWAHVGWTPAINNTGDQPTYPDSPVVYENGDTIDLTASIDLYPYLKEGYWLIFDNYISQDEDSTSASFTAPKYYGKDEAVVEPTDYGDSNNDGVDHDTEPYRVGYDFDGWYTVTKNSEGNITGFGPKYTWGQTLTEDTTVYAKWTPRTDTPYMVVIWTQRADDPVDTNDLNNNYDFYKAIETRKGTTGATANFLTADTTLGGTTDSELGYFFTYNEAASDTAGKPIKGDGTTVLNVYYNRRTITINFWTSSSMSTHANISGYAYVPAQDGQYYYYTNPNPTGYYLCGTGPNASSSHPATGSDRSLSSYYWGYASSSSSGHSGYSSLNGNAPATYYANTDSIIAYESDDTGYVSRSSEGYYYERYGSSSYSYFPLYYQYTSTSSYNTGYYPVGEGPTPTAEGTHNRVSVTNPMVGLYQAPLYGWPSDPATGSEWAYDDAEDGKHYGITLRDCYDIPDNTHTTEWNIYSEAKDYTAYKTIHWMCEDLEGSFAEKTTTQLGYSSSKSQTQYYDDGKFLGFKAYGHNLSANSTETSGGFVAYTSGAGISTNDAGQNAYIYFTRMAYDLSYMSQGHTVKTQSGVKYQQPLADFAAYEPTNGPAGYYFDGWYKDPGCTEEFDWTDDMPNNNVAVYAKWTMMRFRVTLDYTGGDTSAQVTFPANQASTFRVDYGEKVRDTAIQAAIREGYTLLGWYLDPQGNHPFNFAEAITDQTYNMDLTYKDAPDSERVGTDAVTGDNWTDVGRTNMVGKVTIYALWRQNPIGSDGVRVRYDAIEGDGYFPVNGEATDPRVIIRDDPNVYTDHAKAFVQVASTPEDDENYRFLYWVVMQPVKDAQGNVVMENGEPKLEPTTIKVYPGQTFIVDYDYTVQVEAVKVKWIFKDADGDVDLTDTTTVTKGAVPTHSKPSGYVSGSSYYPVVGWTDGTETYYYDGENHTGANVELPAVNKNTTFTAVYGAPEEVTLHQFTVTWKNWDGTVLATQTYTAGQTPIYPNGTPTRPDDSNYTYTFSGWTPAVTVVSGDATYTANYTAADRTFTVTFHANGGAFGSADTTTVSNVTKGTLYRDIFPTADPTHSSYTFLGWFTAATGGTEVTDATEFDGTVLDLYAHYYAYYVYQDTSGTFIDGEVYVFRFTLGSTNYYLNATSSTGRLNGTNTSPIPVTAQWTAHASSSTGFYFENLNYSGSYIYDYTSNTDYAALSTTNYWRMLLEAGSTSGTFYFYTPGNSNDYYMYYGYSSYSSTRYFQWSTSSATAFTVMHREKRDMNADSGTGGAGSSGTMAVVSPESPAVVQRAIFGEVKSEPNATAAPAVTRGNTQPVKATNTLLTEGFEGVTVTKTATNTDTLGTGWTAYNGNNILTTSYYGWWSAYQLGSTAHGGSYAAQYYYRSDYSADCYLISPAFTVSSNATKIDLQLYAMSQTTTYPEKFDVFFVDASQITTAGGVKTATAGNGKYVSLGETTVSSTTWTEYNGTSVTGLAGKSVRLVIHACSDMNMYYLWADDVTVTETVSDTPSYTITWNYKDASGADASTTSTVLEGNMPTAPSVPQTYTKNGRTWTFNGWDPSVVAATGNTTYTAKYRLASYTITWSYKDASGNDTSVTTEAAPGETPAPGFTPASYTSGDDEYRFKGWTPEIVAATGPATYTAQYTSVSYAITWHIKTDGGTWTTVTTTVAEGTVPAYSSHPVWEDENGDEWMFSGWAASENGEIAAPVAATADADYWAQYTKVGVYTYTMYLHAVYGPYNKSGTHITWFGNNDPTGETAGVSVEHDKGLTINFGYDIPTPTTFFNGTKDHAADADPATSNMSAAATGLTYEDHVFLGWARLEADPNDTAGKGTAHPELGEDDLYLKWTGTGYEYKAPGSDNWVSAAKIAADEMSPYQDMYAVWGKVFYVCHSGTGVVERRVISATTGTGETRAAKTFNLIENLDKTNYLYGGYYKAYDGKDSTYGKSLWTAPEEAATAAELNATGSAVVTKTNAVEKYVAAKVNPGVTWQWADAYKDAPGNAIVPVAGQTYYVKEVPTSYLQHYTHYTYKFGTTNGVENLITKLWMVTDVDDNNYWHVGIKYLTKDNEAKVVKSLTISTETKPVTTVKLEPSTIFGSKGVTNGYLAYTAIAWPNVEDNKIDNILNFWVTPDNMMVTGTAQRGLVDIQSADTIHIETLTTVDSTITRYKDS